MSPRAALEELRAIKERTQAGVVSATKRMTGHTDTNALRGEIEKIITLVKAAKAEAEEIQKGSPWTAVLDEALSDMQEMRAQLSITQTLLSPAEKKKTKDAAQTAAADTIDAVWALLGTVRRGLNQSGPTPVTASAASDADVRSRSKLGKALATFAKGTIIKSDQEKAQAEVNAVIKELTTSIGELLSEEMPHEAPLQRLLNRAQADGVWLEKAIWILTTPREGTPEAKGAKEVLTDDMLVAMLTAMPSSWSSIFEPKGVQKKSVYEFLLQECKEIRAAAIAVMNKKQTMIPPAPVPPPMIREEPIQTEPPVVQLPPAPPTRRRAAPPAGGVQVMLVKEMQESKRRGGLFDEHKHKQPTKAGNPPPIPAPRKKPGGAV